MNRIEALLPPWRDWLFSIKSLIAASLALYIALRIDLPRPYWAVATVYIVSQPLAGSTVSKALYRLLGTALGGMGAVLLVPNLVNTPELLTLGLSLWTGGCLYLSLMDRRPHSYMFMLAGYTAPIIGFPSVDDPGAIFITAISRVQEIGLGIVCASLVGAVVFPQSIRRVFAERVHTWLGHAGLWAQQAMQTTENSQPQPDTTRARLAADAMDIDILATHLGFDPASPHGARRWAEMLRSRMLLMLPLTSSVASRMRALQADGLTPPIRAAVDATQDWLHAGAQPAEAPSLRAMIVASHHSGGTTTWCDLLRANLVVRLRELVDLQSDCEALKRHILGDHGQPTLALPEIDGARGGRARHVDHGLALRSAAAAVLAMTTSTTFWVVSGWTDGSSLPVMAAVVCSFFAAFDNPVGPQLAFAKWTLVAVFVSATYVFAIMPMAQDFETLVLVLMPVLLMAGLIAARPATVVVGLALAANIPTLIGLQGRYVGDFAAFANGGLALIGGMWWGAAITSAARVVQPEWVARRLLRATWRDLAHAAEQRGQGNRAVFASLMLDRAGQLAPRMAAGQEWPDMMAAIRIGLNVVDLRRARRLLPPSMQSSLDGVLDGLAAEFHVRAGSLSHRGRQLRLATLDSCVTDAAALAQGAVRDDMLLGLVGIRLGLYPDAAGYGAPGTGTFQPMVAAE